MSANPSPWLTLDEAAQYARTSTATLLRNVKTQKLRAIKVAGKKLWRFKTTWVDAWLESGGAA